MRCVNLQGTVIEFQPDTAVFYSSKIHILLIKKGV